MPQVAAQDAAEIGSFGKTFGQDIGSALDGVFDGRHFVGEVGLSGFFRRRAVGFLRQEQVGQGFQAGFAGHGGFRPFFRLIRQIEVFYVLELPGSFQFLCQFVVPAALVDDGLADRFLAAGQGLFIVILLLDAAELDFIEAPRRFFPVSGDKGKCIALCKEGKGRLNLGWLYTQGPGDFSDHRFLCHDYLPS